MIKLVIFDFDGVLVDSEYLVAQVRAELLEKYNKNIDLETSLNKFIGLHEDVVNSLIAEQIGEDNLVNFITDYQTGMLLAIDERLLKINNVDVALAQIKQPFCIGSNSALGSLKHKIKATGLVKHFNSTSLFVGDMVAKPKPAPDIYLLAAKQYNVKPEHCLVVEDSVAGIKAALAANMQVIGFYGASHCYEGYQHKLLLAGAKTVFKDMRDLQTILEAL